MSEPLHIAIDGPVASGKGDIAERLSKKLHLLYIYTGSMYRALALACIKEGISCKDEKRVIEILKKISIDISPRSVLLNGEDVSIRIMKQDTAQGASDVGVMAPVRKWMVKRQQEMAKGKRVVMEGRDIGLRVLPEAQLKIYLTASVDVRAHRRYLQWIAKGIKKSYEDTLADTKERDLQDSTRSVDPLQRLPDAWELDTTDMDQEQVVAAIIEELKKKKPLMIVRKTNDELTIMREGGQKLGVIRDTLRDYATSGVSLLEIEKYANELIDKTGGKASFKMVKGYHWATCLCVNEVVVHGIPTNYLLQDGDILTIDIGLFYKGFHTDTASSVIIGNDRSTLKKEKEKFLQVGRETLKQAIELCRIGNRIGQLSASNQHIIEKAGYSIVKSLVGHGIGRDLHEEPQIPNYIRGDIEHTYQFQGGETIAIEPIYVMGSSSVVYENEDGWTITTKDRSPAAVFEHTIAITEDGPLILTKARK